MAFLFKSKKNQDRALASRDGTTGSGSSSLQSATARIKEEKGSRSTPTGSLNSLDNDGSMGSPDQANGRQRGQSLEPQQQSPPQLQQPLQQSQQQQAQQQQASDLPVSFHVLSHHLGLFLTYCDCSFVMARVRCKCRQTPTLRSIRGRNAG
jgi:hypothetical protein